jgi:hypothetical protein
MAAGDHSELLELLKRECDAESAAYKRHAGEAEHHRGIAAQMQSLIRLLESGLTPTAEQVNNLRNGHPGGAGAYPVSNNVPLPPRGVFGRKYDRQPEFESMSIIEAIRAILKQNGPTHADELARRVYKFEPAQFSKIKSTIVSEAVKQVKAKKLRRAGENTFALMEEKV